MSTKPTAAEVAAAAWEMFPEEAAEAVLDEDDDALAAIFIRVARLLGADI